MPACHPSPVTDPEVLFGRYHQQLRARVRLIVNTSEANVEDACMFAWVQLLGHELDQVDAVYSWLVTVAVREAVKLDRRCRRTVAIPTGEDSELLEPADPRDHILGRALLHDAAQLIAAASLTGRQGHLLGLQTLGLTYHEMADETDTSLRAVQRQVLTARRKLANARQALRG